MCSKYDNFMLNGKALLINMHAWIIKHTFLNFRFQKYDLGIFLMNFI